MATASYQIALQMAEALPRDEQMRLIQELERHAQIDIASEEPVSLLDLCGLGQEVWQQMDAQEYVDRERASWNG
ncbi:hypothetical protein [Granulicella mallensis]|jgi:hypothetical protein|uniref:Uncharacterized protein n=1 Tax=Granulicella mallensis TaxID=940614 RepID=A0A7W8EAQ0_9BACT|nr:hypothetical protein [Granulicella mallensis]MBB5065027.1 hypothetical protein [Granulicella mallensis]